ncbi:hypothetical protein M947_04365 [Sulfurimonas hongkongensis]|uniref:Uncharacterized protein n=1 Tax=Sulfurimonas hongkongensis TaxID=1172190 RepID=T0JNW9_9BACT|nr:hypothetical protein [Sulfurimonas hongkongensis]EQB39816.1 hypothetical protein M947_04365 [Sulfurimonas hongkongensis]
MKIKLIKIGKTPVDFEVGSDEMTFKGYLVYDSGKLILLKANLSGFTLCECSRCGEEFKLKVDEEVEFFISDGIFDSDANIDLDVVESFDSMANLDELLISEIELIKSDYHSCKNCKTE